MDDLGADGEEDEDDVFNAAIGLVHIVGFAWLFWLGWKRWCHGPAGGGTAAGDQQASATQEQLQEKKRMSTSYLLWLFAGPLGAHHFYLGRVVHGLLAAWSLNLLGVGWVIDAVLIPFYVRGFNARHTAPEAPYDTSRRSLLCRLPLTLLVVVWLAISFAVYTPWMLHVTGAVDIDRIAAQTQVNPYDMLNISRGASLSEAKNAYRRESLKWHPDRNLGCGKRCETKMSEIAKAFEVIKKRRAPPPPDRTWEGWLQDLGNDWMHVLEVFSADSGQGPSPSPAGTNTGSRRENGDATSRAKTDL